MATSLLLPWCTQPPFCRSPISGLWRQVRLSYRYLLYYFIDSVWLALCDTFYHFRSLFPSSFSALFLNFSLQFFSFRISFNRLSWSTLFTFQFLCLFLFIILFFFFSLCFYFFFSFRLITSTSFKCVLTPTCPSPWLWRLLLRTGTGNKDML